jgi:hypothetical protein
MLDWDLRQVNEATETTEAATEACRRKMRMSCLCKVEMSAFMRYLL